MAVLQQMDMPSGSGDQDIARQRGVQYAEAAYVLCRWIWRGLCHQLRGNAR